MTLKKYITVLMKGFLKLIIKSFQIDAKTIPEQISAVGLFDTKNENNLIPVYIGYIFSVFWLFKNCILFVVNEEKYIKILNDWSIMFDNGRKYVLTSIALWALCNFLIRTQFLMKRDKIPQALHIVGENKYRCDDNYFSEYHRNKLRNIDKFLLKMLHVMKISCLIGSFFLTFMTIEWNYERWIIIIFNDMSWCILGYIGVANTIKGLLVTMVTFIQVNAYYGVYFEVIQAKLFSVNKSKRLNDKRISRKEHLDLLNFSYTIIQSLMKSEKFFNLITAAYFFTFFVIIILCFYTIIFISTPPLVTFVLAEFTVYSFFFCFVMLLGSAAYSTIKVK